MKFRKKPVVIEAIHYTGTSDSNREVIDWTRGSKTFALMDSVVRNCSPEHPEGFDYPVLKIATWEGDMVVSPGDWVIRGVSGEHYPCKPDIFAATYEPTDCAGQAPEAATPGAEPIDEQWLKKALAMAAVCSCDDVRAAIAEDSPSRAFLDGAKQRWADMEAHLRLALAATPEAVARVAHSDAIGREACIEFAGRWEDWPVSPRDGGCPYWATILDDEGPLLKLRPQFGADAVWIAKSAIKKMSLLPPAAASTEGKAE